VGDEVLRIRAAAQRSGWSRTVEASRRDVYEALVRLAEGGQVEISFTDLAEACGRSRPLVVEAVRDLVAAGLIAHHPPIKHPQRQQPSLYELL